MEQMIYGPEDELLVNKWQPVLEAEEDGLDEIKSDDAKMGIARMLENTSNYLNLRGTSEATPTNVAGGIAGYPDIVIPLVRRIGPAIIEINKIASVQPMNGPTGLAFAMRPRYQTQAGPEIHLDPIRTDHTGFDSAGANGGTATPNVASDVEQDPFAAAYTAGAAMDTLTGEGDVMSELGLTLDSISIASRTRSLKVNQSHEMMQDLANQHRVDSKQIFVNLSTENLKAAMANEVLRNIYISSVQGGNAGVYDLDTATDGRWLGEKGQILSMRIAKEANFIMQNTRVGHGTFAIVDSNVFTLLSESGMLLPAGPSNTNFTGGSILIKDQMPSEGTLRNGIKIYRDDNIRVTNPNEGTVLVGYRGAGQFESGMIFSPYVPIWNVDAVDQDSGQPISFFKTRYGIASANFAEQNGAITPNTNPFFRRFQVTNILF